MVTPASLAPLVAAQIVPSGTLRTTGFTLTAGVQDAINSSAGTFVVTFPAGAAAPVGCRVGLYLKDITNAVTFAVTDGSTVDGFNLAVDTYSLDGPDNSALAWRRESSSAWVYDGLTGVLSSGGGGGGADLSNITQLLQVVATHTHSASNAAVAPNISGVGALTITMNANGSSWAPTNVPSTTGKRFPLQVDFVQGAAGSFTLALGAINWGDAPTPTLPATAGSILSVVFEYRGGALRGFVQGLRTA